MNMWLVIIILGALTFAIRLSFVSLVGQRAMPPALQRTLRFVPVTVLPAIILPEVLAPQGVVNLSLTNARLIMAVVAALIAWRTHNAMLTIAVGMIGLWILQAIWH